MEFKDILRKLRKEHGLTQKTLAELTGMSEQAIINYERGSREPTGKAIRAFENFFSVNAAYLFGDTTDKHILSKSDNLKFTLFGRAVFFRERWKECERLLGEEHIVTATMIYNYTQTIDLLKECDLLEEFYTWGENHFNQPNLQYGETRKGNTPVTAAQKVDFLEGVVKKLSNHLDNGIPAHR